MKTAIMRVLTGWMALLFLHPMLWAEWMREVPVQGRPRHRTLTKIFMGMLLSLAAPSWGFSAVSRAAWQEETHSARITLRTDVLTQVPANKIKVHQADQTGTLLTDADGVTPWFSIQAELPFTLTLKQKSTPDGMTVGQIRTYTSHAIGVDHPVSDLLNVFQPLLQPVVLDSSLGHSVGLGARWRVEPLPDSSYAFPASIGVLLTPSIIEGFREYYGLQFPESNYVMGIIVHVDEAESLGNGVALEVDFATYGINDLPAVDWGHVALHPGDLGTGDYEVTPALWDPSESPSLCYYFLTGSLGKGMNVLLFGGGASGDSSEQLASPPTFPMAASSGGSAPLEESDCIPEPAGSAPGQTCSSTDTCDDSPGCPDSGSCVITVSDCMSWKVPVGQKVCGKNLDGDDNKVTWTTTFMGGVNFEITIGGEEAGGSVEVGGESGSSNSMTHTKGSPLGEGSGCGECSQWFQEYTSCSKYCTIHKRHFSWFLGGRWWCEDERCPLACVRESGQDYARCPRTCD